MHSKSKIVIAKDFEYKRSENRDYVMLWGLQANEFVPETGAQKSISIFLTDVQYETLVHLPTYLTISGKKRYNWWTDENLEAVRAIESMTGVAEGSSCKISTKVEMLHPSGYYMPKQPVLMVRGKCGSLECNCSKIVRDTAEKLADHIGSYTNDCVRVLQERISPVVRELTDRNWERAGTYIIDNMEIDSSLGVYVASMDDIRPTAPLPAYPTIMAFDIEVLGHTTGNATDPNDPRDFVYMTSIVIKTTKPGSKTIQRLHTVEDAQLEGVDSIVYPDEQQLISGVFEDIRKYNPDYIIGYNILGYDFGYLATRMAMYAMKIPNVSCFPNRFEAEFSLIPGPKGRQYSALMAAGRVSIDMMKYVMSILPPSKIRSYSLANVTNHYLEKDETKIDLSAQQQYAIIRHLFETGDTTEGIGGDPGMSFRRLAEYCTRDSTSVLSLLMKLKTLEQIRAFMNILTASAQDISTAGLSRHVEGGLYRAYRTTGHFWEFHTEKQGLQGGFVHCSINRRIVRDVGILDFKSMYPSIMMAMGLDPSKMLSESYTTTSLLELLKGHYTEYVLPYKLISKDSEVDPENFVDYVLDEEAKDEDDVDSEADEQIGEESERNSEPDILHFSKRYGIPPISRPFDKKTVRDRNSESTHKKRVFLVSDDIKRGAIPMLLENLFEARAKAKKSMEKLERTADPAEILEYERLDAEQNSIKVAMNTIYGVMASHASYATFEIAALTTMFGREMICETNLHLQKKYGGVHVYSDTDSTMMKFPELDRIAAMPISDAEKYSLMKAFLKEAGQSVNRILPRPMQLEFEAVAKSAVFICPKMYVAFMYSKDGSVTDDDFKQRGILERRSNCPPIAKRAIADYRKSVLMARSKEDLDIAIKRLREVVRRFATAIEEGKSDFDKELMYTIMCRPLEHYKSDRAPVVKLMQAAREQGFELLPGVRVMVAKYATGNGKTMLCTPELAEALGYPMNYERSFMENVAKPIAKIAVGAGLAKDDCELEMMFHDTREMDMPKEFL